MTTFKMPEPVAYFYHDARNAESANPLLHSTMLVHRTERRSNCSNETPLYTAEALHDVLEQAAQIADVNDLRKIGDGKKGWTSPIAAAIRSMKEHIA